jgi:two-component system, NarL family, response regulator LiaR
MNKNSEPEGKTIRVLIVDDHAMVRQGLRTFLELHNDPAELRIEVVGEAVNGIEAVELARRTRPDIVLLDLVMPEMDGIQATARILECSPNSRVMILTSFGEEDKVVPAIQAGAHGYLLKDISPDQLIQSIRNAHRGEVQLHPNAARQLMFAVAQRNTASDSRASELAVEDLTIRECEILDLIARGMSNREIAEKTFISEKTVKTHVSNILGKLHLEDRTQAAIYALKHGFAKDKD